MLGIFSNTYYKFVRFVFLKEVNNYANSTHFQIQKSRNFSMKRTHKKCVDIRGDKNDNYNDEYIGTIKQLEMLTL